MNMANQRTVALGVMAILDRIQRLKSGPEVQVLAGAAFFLESCRAFGVSPQEAMTAVGNMISREGGVVPEYRAMRQYISKEIL
jgi:hypothetical protein